LAMSGVAGVTRKAVEEALGEYAQSKNGRFQAATGPESFPDVMVIGEQGDRITVVYPGEFMEWDEASAHLSRSLGVPVFSFHIHDDDLWMYTLFAGGGEEVGHFNPIPDYWFEDISDEERELWAGDAKAVADHWPGVQPDAIDKYLAVWDLDEQEPGKAYDDDQFPYNDCWQLIDFMRRLGLAYPIDEQGRVLGVAYRFEVASS